MISTSSSATVAKEGLGNAFYLVWLGQFVSSFGTMLTTFGLSVWLFQRTGSVLDFTTMVTFSTLPAVLLLSWSGGFVDRHNKRKVLIACDVSAAVCVATIGLLIWFDRFALWHLYLVQAVLSIGTAFQGPAAYVTITNLVPRSQLGRASGMFALSNAVSQLTAPLLAASLLATVHLHGIILLDLLTFSAALAGLLLARFPASLLSPNAATVRKSGSGTFHDAGQALSYFERNPTLALVFAYTSMGGFLLGCVMVLVAPLVLAMHDEHALAWITSAGAAGGVISGMFMVAWGGPKRWTPALLALNLGGGVALAVGGYATSVPLLCASAFGVMFCSTLLSAAVQSVWRRKVPRERQGSISALQQAVTMSLIPLSAIVGGVFSHYLFEPALMPGGIWHDSVGAWFGQGKGRGTGFFFLVIGTLGAILAVCSLCTRRLYRLEAEVPDAP